MTGPFVSLRYFCVNTCFMAIWLVVSSFFKQRYIKLLGFAKRKHTIPRRSFQIQYFHYIDFYSYKYFVANIGIYIIGKT
jgi:hypothetical protein